MNAQFVGGLVPERFVEVDAARLLLILARFANDVDDAIRELFCFPSHPVVGHFTPEYYLHKLDFLLRYPSYFAYEITELHRLGIASAADGSEVRTVVRTILREREPELQTQHFRRFWRGAYERIDRVEAWWHAREIVFRGLEQRGDSPPQKHYFLTANGREVAARLVANVPEVRWYVNRINLLHQYFGGLTPAEVRNMQYRHPEYRQAQLDELIPDLAPEAIADNFAIVFGEPLGVPVV